ncbi:MAG: DUF3047 domain-containing protein [Methylothermaceae bacterium]|nr:DUF3047 domain-containing protein [Methylothermaceae bacterium]
MHDTVLLEAPEFKSRLQALLDGIPEGTLQDYAFFDLASDRASWFDTGIDVEFDSQDITYYWSTELPVGTVYRCPIPTWNARETHVVVRSGEQGLGEWIDEARDVYQDYVDAIGGPMPENIVRVWLIAVSLFQRTEGKCQYDDIAFLQGKRTIQVR